MADEEMPIDDIQASVERQFTFCCQPRNFNDETDEQEFAIKEESPEADEERAEEGLRPGIATVTDLTDDEPSSESVVGETSTQTVPEPARNRPIEENTLLKELNHDSGKCRLKPGVVVEIVEIKDLYHASYLKIQHIIQTSKGVVLRGLPFARTRFLRCRLPRYRNEVCLILQIDEDDERDDEIQAAVEVPVTDIIRTRNLRCTNADFPLNRFENIYATVEEIERNGLLCCRWKYQLMYRSARARESRQAPCQYILAHLRAEELSTARGKANDTARLNRWRGSKLRGGSYNMNTGQDLRAVERLELESDASTSWIDKMPGQRYTLGDMFSGAGGTSLGAQQAGFHVRVACDNAPHACMTHQKNFPQADLREEDIWKFIKEDLIWGGKSDHVDVVHLSPPCQFWSPAHTVPGRNDEANIAVLFSCHELIKKLKPRLFTLEQTYGILHPRFEHYFNALIHGFTQLSYSIRWKVVDLLEWGTASRRNRLIMIGACPGESLPTIPPGTHMKNPTPGSTLKPLVTVMDAMRRIPPDATLHNKKHIRFKEPWDPEIPLARCITTHGGYGNYHFSGKRDFTLRELATMNGFPTSYQFHPQNAKKQIGNAFPPCGVRVLYTHLLRWLEKEDRVRPVEEQAMYEEEPEYDLVESEVDDDIQFIRVNVKRRNSIDSDSGVDFMDIDGHIFCIDPSQMNRGQPSSPIDLTADSPAGSGQNSPIVVLDDDEDVPT
ncbi:C-5 cytosine-specific DNA methylase [Seiridium cupressi]